MCFCEKDVVSKRADEETLLISFTQKFPYITSDFLKRHM